MMESVSFAVLDFSETLNITIHDILLNMLKSCSLCAESVDLLIPYLSQNLQRVKHGNSLTELKFIFWRRARI